MFKKIWAKWKNLVYLIGSILVFLFVGVKLLQFAKIGKVKKKKNFRIIDDTTITLVDKKGNHMKAVKLPKDPETGKQIKSEDVTAAGAGKGGIVNIEIKHNITNRSGSKSSGN